MTVWVLFVVIGIGSYGTTSFQYEFKDLKQCQLTYEKMQKHFDQKKPVGFCQEIRK